MNTATDVGSVAHLNVARYCIARMTVRLEVTA
ncbi:hypothetical protein AWB81_03519 [Caballeronia arationis]|jgi:hypothetical protein|uniref:Uncharacterized protein n=1 Tax=Caballeronia arationis TaxID=1777142 RepID=A0A7Z7I8W6_9BURK|nr:hypothetical protein AWB81_03519 [Caballeronia arationis]SOE81458.1 hypothetical protein SAMN05446927_4743 [Caballeronia arationis]